MAKESEKSPVLREFLQELAGRSTAIELDMCVRAPIGCGGPASEFRDAISRREYAISGLCQRCQDSVFGVGEEEEEN